MLGFSDNVHVLLVTCELRACRGKPRESLQLIMPVDRHMLRSNLLLNGQNTTVKIQASYLHWACGVTVVHDIQVVLILVGVY